MCEPVAPRPPQKPLTRSFHGDTFSDPYDWLREAENPEVLAHLAAENAWYEARTNHLAELRQQLVTEMNGHFQEDDVTVPVRDGNWWYFRRTRPGKAYPSYHRLPARTATGQPEPLAAPPPAPKAASAPTVELLLDINEVAAGHDFTQVANLRVSPDHRFLVYGVDHAGDEVFRLIIRDLQTGMVIDEAVADAVYGVAWAADGRSLYYLRADDAWRAHELWHHRVGSDPATDRLLWREDDDRFGLFVANSRDGNWIVVSADSTDTSETWLLPATAKPETPLWSVGGRHEGVEYQVEPAGDHLLLIHNFEREDFCLAAAELPPAELPPAELPIDCEKPGNPADWQVIAAPAATERFLGVDAFATQAALSLRAEGFAAVRPLVRTGSDVIQAVPTPTPTSTGQGVPSPAALVQTALAQTASAQTTSAQTASAQTELAQQHPHSLPGWQTQSDIAAENPVRTVELAQNPWWEASAIRVKLESLVQPATVLDYFPASTQTVVRRQKEVPGYDPTQYREEQIWTPAADGTQIPVITVARRDTAIPAPTLLYGYGSYEISIDPSFSEMRLPLLDRGVVFALAQVRGGGELGRAWYEAGRLSSKTNTFTDFVAVGQHLLASGITASGRLAAEGRSAGGLLMGAAANLAPELFCAIHAGVPFVDALTTILNPDLPLTVGEWEEWGNPIVDPAVYEQMRSYSPYENIAAGKQYPAILATTGINDTRVNYVEPTKWVARLRDLVTNDPIARPILLHCELVGGHGGRTGRYARRTQRAEELAFLLDHLGVGQKSAGGSARPRT